MTPASGAPVGPRLAAALLAVALGVSACATTTASPPSSAMSRYVEGLAAAERTGARFTPATEAVPGVTMEQAYALQARLIAERRARGDQAAGFKGGLMSAKSLADRGVAAPLTGVLFQSGESSGAFALCGYRQAIFELKLGYVFKAPVRRRVASVGELRSFVSAVQPVIELPDIAYRNPDAYGAIDMVAANITAARYVRGGPSPPDVTDLDALRVRIERDGVQLASGLGRESLGGQWESLLTLVNLIVDRGGAIEPGQFVLTGKIGDKGSVDPGVYTAEYGPLGVVRFQVTSCR